jgi:tetratricopeptide (TPR) repeat protein
VTVEAVERARRAAALGQSDEALAALDEVLAASPDELDALLLKSRLLREGRRDEEALTVSRHAAAAWPRSSAALNAVARSLHAMGRDEEALAPAQEARRLLTEGENFRQAAPVYLTLVWCLRELRRLREAMAMAEEGLARTPDVLLAEWAGQVEEELARSERERC